MDFFRFHTQGAGQLGDAGDLLSEQLPLGPHLPGGDAVGYEGAVAVAAFQEPLGRQTLVDAENGVLIDGQFDGQRADRGEPVAGVEGPAGALARICAAICRVMGMPDEVSTRMCMAGSSDYTSITAITGASMEAHEKRAGRLPALFVAARGDHQVADGQCKKGKGETGKKGKVKR